MSKVIAEPVDWNINEKTLGLEQMMWRKRTVACRNFISLEDKSVLDVGAGNMYLKNILPDSVDYYPLDYTKRCEDTIVCDLNKREFPDIKVDVAVCAGIIEYVNDLEWFFDQLVARTDKIILTYRSREKGFSQSLFTTEEIVHMLKKRGFIPTDWNKELADDWPLLACFEKVSLKSLTRNYYCTGCGACVNVCSRDAISFEFSSQGFYKPKIDFERCVNCGRCMRVCPELCEVKSDNYSEENCECFAIWADDVIREKSSSGGAFSMVAQDVIAKKGVVFGAVYSDNFFVHHKSAHNIDELDPLRKSKYIQSNTEKTFREVYQNLNQGKQVLYVGTPCQIAGLYAFLGKDYVNLLTIDLVCFCVTPVLAFQAYLKENYDMDQLSNVVFRDKQNGWNCNSYSIHFKDGHVIYKDINTDDYQKAFHNVLCRNHVCDSCRYAGFPRQADITLGDFWGIEQHDVSLNDGKGTSLVIANNPKGIELMHEMSDKFQRIQKVPVEWCRGKGNRIGNDGRSRHELADCFMEMIPKYGFKKSLDTVLNKKHDLAMVCMHNHNYGNNLTNYALYQCLKDMGLTVAVVNRSLDAEWTEIKSDMAMFAHNPYDSCDLIPDFETRIDKKQVNDWCNIFIVASDQLFRAEFIQGMDFHPCLDWVSSDKYMFSYGTSFGTDEFVADNTVKGKTKFYLNRFNALSVREKSGVELLQKEFGLESKWVLDPVFLCDSKYYYNMAQMGKMRLPKQKYIGAYILDPSKVKEKIFIKLKDQLHYETNVLSDADGDFNVIKKLWDITILPEALVEEWLANVCYCDLFVTDSFHGLCFALIFNKNFIVVTEQGNWRGRARLESLLSMLGLEDRLIESVDELSDELIEVPMDYITVNQKLNDLRRESMNWLQMQIREGKEYKGTLQAYDIFDAKYDHTIQTNEKLKHQMEQLSGANQCLVQQMEQMSQINNELVGQVQQLICSNEAMNGKMSDLMNSQEMFLAENQRLNRELSAVYSSTSWRLTGGLRWIKRLFMKLRK